MTFGAYALNYSYCHDISHSQFQRQLISMEKTTTSNLKTTITKTTTLKILKKMILPGTSFFFVMVKYQIGTRPFSLPRGKQELTAAGTGANNGSDIRPTKDGENKAEEAKK